MKKEFVVQNKKSCKLVYIPRGYCTIYLQGQAKDHIEMSKTGGDVCIENLADDLPCQEVIIPKKEKKPLPKPIKKSKKCQYFKHSIVQKR